VESVGAADEAVLAEALFKNQKKLLKSKKM
jgi:hypothetical protein